MLDLPFFLFTLEKVKTLISETSFRNAYGLEKKCLGPLEIFFYTYRYIQSNHTYLSFIYFFTHLISEGSEFISHSIFDNSINSYTFLISVFILHSARKKQF